MRAAILARVSNEEQAGPMRRSVQTQVELLRGMADSRGWEVVRVYEIPGESAYADEHGARPMFEAAVEAACRREFDVLLIAEFSRFSRSERIAHDVLYRMRKAGCGLVALNGTDYAAERDYASIESWMANRASRDHANRVRNGHRGKFERGLLIGDVPFGYRRPMIVDQRGATVPDVNAPVEPVPEEAEAVRWAFAHYTRWGGHQAIADEFNRRGLRPRSKVGRRLFEGTSIESILSNRAYAGWVTYKGESREGLHEAIVTLEEWAAVQARVQRRTRQPRATKLLSGLLRCLHCQRSMVTEVANERYVDRRRANSPCPVGGRGMAMELAHAGIVEAVGALTLDEEPKWAEYVNQQLRRPGASGANERAALEGEKRRITKAYQLGAMEDHEFEEALRGVRARMARLQPEENAMAMVMQRITSFGQVWAMASEQGRNAALGLLLEAAEADILSGEVWLRPRAEFVGLAEIRRSYVAEYFGTPDWNRTSIGIGGMGRAPSGLFLPIELVAA